MQGKTEYHANNDEGLCIRSKYLADSLNGNEKGRFSILVQYLKLIGKIAKDTAKQPFPKRVHEGDPLLSTQLVQPVDIMVAHWQPSLLLYLSLPLRCCLMFVGIAAVDNCIESAKKGTQLLVVWVASIATTIVLVIVIVIIIISITVIGKRIV